MDLLLSKRASQLIESMEDPQCDKQKLFNTYDQFVHINSLVSQWARIYRKHIRPIMKKKARLYSLLDIGFGGGDVAINLARWAKKDGFDLQVSGVELDPRCLEYVQQRQLGNTVDFRCASYRTLIDEGRRYDFVISNHILHHLDTNEFDALLASAEQLASHSVIFNDLYRHVIAYCFFAVVMRPFFHRSFIIQDGLTSIKRSYTAKELSQLIPKQWRVEVMLPFRLLLRYDAHPVI